MSDTTDTPNRPPSEAAAAKAKVGTRPKPIANNPPMASQPDVALTPAPATSPDRASQSWVKVGVGVGSAALVAALLYATRSKRNDWTK